jgi:hypothetical protein
MRSHGSFVMVLVAASFAAAVMFGCAKQALAPPCQAHKGDAKRFAASTFGSSSPSASARQGMAAGTQASVGTRPVVGSGKAHTGSTTQRIRASATRTEPTLAA